MRAIDFCLSGFVLVLTGLVACAPRQLTEREVATLVRRSTDQNTKAFEAAKAGALRQHQLTPRPVQRAGLELDSPNDTARLVRVVSTAPDRGLLAGEQLVLIEQQPGRAPELALVVPSCANGHSCGCREPATHLIGIDPAGRDVIVRLREVVETRQVRRSGSCSYGCGQPTPAQQPSIYLLDASPDSVRIVDVPYTHRDLEVVCDDMVPQP